MNSVNFRHRSRGRFVEVLTPGVTALAGLLRRLGEAFHLSPTQVSDMEVLAFGTAPPSGATVEEAFRNRAGIVGDEAA